MNGKKELTIKTVKFEYIDYPEFITKGFHSRFIFPVAKEICKGVGLDIGCNNPEWTFPGAYGIDVDYPKEGINAMNIPESQYGWDYIFSSHCLEHIPDYMAALRHWTEHLKQGGVLFLYLPHADCAYWKPWKMPTRKHLHQFDAVQVREMLYSLGYKNVFASGRDAAYSFCVYGEKS